LNLNRISDSKNNECEIVDIIFLSHMAYIYLTNKETNIFFIKMIIKRKNEYVVIDLDGNEYQFAVVLLLLKHMKVDENRNFEKYTTFNDMDYGIFEKIVFNGIEYLYLVNVDNHDDYFVQEIIVEVNEVKITNFVDGSFEFDFAILYLAKKHRDDKNYNLLNDEDVFKITEIAKKLKL